MELASETTHVAVVAPAARYSSILVLPPKFTGMIPTPEQLSPSRSRIPDKWWRRGEAVWGIFGLVRGWEVAVPCPMISGVVQVHRSHLA